MESEVGVGLYTDPKIKAISKLTDFVGITEFNGI